jgi:hypothetical protein
MATMISFRLSLPTTDAKMQLSATAGIELLQLEQKVSWLTRAKRMSVEALQHLHADLDVRVKTMRAVPTHDSLLLAQLKQLKLYLKQMIEEKGGTTQSTASAMKQAA